MSGIAEYRRRVQARHRPVVAVATAPEVDACLARSGLTLVDALRPWSDVRGISFSVRLNPESGYPHVLSEFGVRFHDARECARVPGHVVDAHVAAALEPWSAADAPGLARALAGVPSDVPSLIAHARGERTSSETGGGTPMLVDDPATSKTFAAPWLDAYHARFDRAMQFADHEAIDHPVGVVYAVMANVPGEDPAEAYRRLAQDPASFPPCLRDAQLADPDVPTHCVLVHDASSPSAMSEADLEALRAKTQIAIGPSSGGTFVLPVNGAREPVVGRADAWSGHIETGLASTTRGIEPVTSGCAARGAYLSDEDIERHRVFVAELVNLSLLPSMDRRAKALNAVIIANRKGLKNQLKSFWGRSTGQIAKPEGDGGYARDCIESRMRIAADLSMALRDYEGAAGLYRLLAADYKADKAWRRLGAAQESLGHALAMTQTPRRWTAEGPPHREARREAESALESAAGYHARAAATGTEPGTSQPANAPQTDRVITPADRARWATKAGLAHASFLAACGAHRECASPLMRASAEDSQNHARAALLLEGAAHAYLRAEVPMPRKAAIHMVLAGHRFNQAQLRAYAVRCYACALTVYAHEGAPLGKLAASWHRLGRENGEVDEKVLNAKSTTDRDGVRTGDLGDTSATNAGWSRAKEHLHFALGRQVAHAGEMTGAGRYFRELLTCAERQPAATQATYLKEYLFVCQRAMETAEGVPANEGDGKIEGGGKIEGDGKTAKRNPPVPTVDVGDVHVRFHDQRVDLGFGGDASAATTPGERDHQPACATWPRSRWNALEEDGLITPELRAVGGPTWLDKPREKGGVQRNVCVLGEPIGVDVRMRNPLKVEVSVTNARLVCESEESEGDEGDESSVSTPAMTVALSPKETKTVRLVCVPTKPGKMRIVGVAWTLADVVRGYAAFDVRAPRTRRAAQTREWVRDVPREKRLAFTVVDGMPKIVISIHGVPRRCPRGASVPCRLRVSNESTSPGGPVARRVRVRLPGGGVCVPADDASFGELLNGGGWSACATPGNLSAHGSFADGLAKLTMNEPPPSKPGGPPRRRTAGPIASSPASLDGLVYAPNAWETIEPGASVAADFWLHPTGACGPLDLPFVVSFEPPAPAPPLLKYRAVRLAAGTDVVPSVECSVTAHRHSGDPAGRVLKVSLVHSDAHPGLNPGVTSNVTSSSFAMTRVSLVRAAEGSRLRLTPLGHPVDKPRIAAPGRGWDTILAMQADDDGKNDEKYADGESPAAALDFGVGDAPPSPAPHPPHVRLHRAMTPLDLAAAAPPFPKSLLGVDAVVEWLEILPPDAPVGQSPAAGACHVFNVAGALARDPARAKAFGSRAFDPPGVGAPAGAAGAGGSTRPQPDWDVRWTLTGPAAVTLPDGSGESAEISVTLRAHNPSPEAVRLTFRSTCGDDDDGGGWKRATLGGWGEPAATPPAAVSPPPAAPPPPPSPPPIPRYPIRTIPPGRAWMWTGAVKKTVIVRSGETVDVALRAEAFARGVFVMKDYALSWTAAEGGGDGDEKIAHPAQACNAPFVVEVR